MTCDSGRLRNGEDAPKSAAECEASQSVIAHPSPDSQDTREGLVERLGPAELYGAVGMAMFNADLGGLRIDQKINLVGNAAYELLTRTLPAPALVEALRNIAGQPTADEMTGVDGPTAEEADFEGGYNHCIETARAAILAMQEALK